MASIPATAKPARDSELEKTILVTWPSVSATAWGQFLGRWYANPYGVPVFNVGNLCVLLSIPIAVPLYLRNFAPRFATRYRITNRRILVERGVKGNIEKALSLDEFDQVTFSTKPGQAWFRSADVTFFNTGEPILELPGVPYPTGFVKTCRNAQAAFRFALKLN